MRKSNSQTIGPRTPQKKVAKKGLTTGKVQGEMKKGERRQPAWD